MTTERAKREIADLEKTTGMTWKEFMGKITKKYGKTSIFELLKR